MSCNRVAHQSSGIAAKLGITKDALEASWSDGRKTRVVKICPSCRNSFLRSDGGCTKCEKNLAKWAQKNPARYRKCFLNGSYPAPAMKILAPVMVDAIDDAKVKVTAARHLTKPEKLDELAHLKDTNIQAAVAGNVNTSPQTLAVLLKHKKAKVYEQAIRNPGLSVAALEGAHRQAKKNWQKTLQLIAKRMSSGAMIYGSFSFFGGGKDSRKKGQFIALAMLGMYGATAYGPYRRYRALRNELQRRQPEAQEKGGEGIAETPPAVTGSGAPRAPRSGGVLSGLTQQERNLYDDGLDIAQSYIEGGRNDYGDDLSVEDIERLRNYGPQSERDKNLVGGIIAEMEAAERDLPGWFNATPDEFQALRDKLGVPLIELQKAEQDATDRAS